MSFTKYSATAVAFLSLFASTYAVYSGNSHKNLAVYWGQGSNQAGLRTYCDAPEIDIIPIGFINAFTAQADGLVAENFGNMCWGGEYYPGTDGNPSPLYKRCPQLQEDLYYCQQNTKTKIVLSLGGDAKGYQITGAQEGIALAEFLWGAYGPYSQAWVDQGKPRPLDRGLYNTNATMQIDIDGFDFDIEHASTDLSAGYIACIKRLRELFATSTSGKQYLITGAPQCPLPEQNMGQMISGAKFDALFIQFYNNGGYGCTGRNWTNANPSYDGLEKASGFNYKAWTAFISGGESKTARLYIGLPASDADAAAADYLTPREAKNLVSAYQQDPNFGGVMLWEATGASANVQDVNGPLISYPGLNYYQVMRNILDGTIPTTSTSSSSDVTSATTSSSSSMTRTSVSTTSSVPLTTSSFTSSSVTTSTTAIPTPTTVPSVGSCTFLGCYTEAEGVRALSANTTIDYTKMSVEICASFCSGYDLFGVEYGGECYCGDSLGLGSTLASPQDCNMPCDGTPTEFCGAGNRLNVYQCASISTSSTSSATTPAASGSTSVVVTSTSSSVSQTSSSSMISTSTTSETTASTSSSSQTATSASSSIGSSVSATISTPISSSSSSTSSLLSSVLSSTISSSLISSSTLLPSSSTILNNTTISSATLISTETLTTSTSLTSPISISASVTSSTSTFSTLPPFRNTTFSASSPTSTSGYAISTITPSSDNASAISSTITSYRVSTIYTTTVYTITSCAATVPDCPAKVGQLTTEVISSTTYICPVTDVTSTASTATQPVASTSASEGSIMTTTIRSTSTSLVTVSISVSTATVVPVQSLPPYPTGGSTQVMATGSGALPSVSLAFASGTGNPVKAVATHGSSSASAPSKALTAGAGSLRAGSGLLGLVVLAIMM